ncbi:carbonic anhydrase [Methylocystis sp. WRRC1]|uniref:carbonic anhydrase n=1 Tax=Methylocystis sp. WRRC1 TaxID=1732014 RepID=UPI001D15C18B|nr:carbonic anhydrase [Methylocystis sp. WRRC1]MCC3247293.1 carbonic anhydrase [Methylocystis sp. WRRC1]
MQRLIQGLHHFQNAVFGSQRELFERLAKGQAPETLFITCSDSRIDPNLLTQTVPGELFIMRNAGNLVPPYGASQGGEAATIEFAVAGLGVKEIVVCGHSHCGAMKGLLDPPPAKDFPALTQWLGHAESTRRVVRDKYADREGASLINITIQENVLAQLENLRTHPVVASGLAQSKLKLHGWVYKIETGEVFGYDPESGQFRLLTEQPSHRTDRERQFEPLDV